MDGHADIALPTIDPPLITVRLRVSPLPVVEVPRWRIFFGRLPAVCAIRLDGFDGTAATFFIETLSVARLHAQLRHIARTLSATFAPTDTGALAIALPPDDVLHQTDGVGSASSPQAERSGRPPIQETDTVTLTYDLERDRERARGVAGQRQAAGGRGGWLAAALRGARGQRAGQAAGGEELDLMAAARGWA